MQIRYLAPLEAAYARMRSALFRPFTFERWMYFAFACWCAGWGAGSTFGGFGPLRNKIDTSDLQGTWDSMREMALEVWSDPLSRVLLWLAAVLLVVLFVVSIWVQARSELVFLETTARDRLAFWAPWREYAREGNSLFLWRLVFHVLALVLLGGLALALFEYAFGGAIPFSESDVRWIPLFVIVTFLWIPAAIVTGVVFLFLRHFVTPIMYRDRVKTNEAWRRFLRILRAHPGDFFLYVLFYVGILIVASCVVLIGTCVTCCVLGCLLAIPFLGTVLYLPVSYTLRALGPEFLAQFPGEPPILAPLVIPLTPPSGPVAPPIA